MAITADAGEERLAEIVARARPRRGPAVRRGAAGADRAHRPSGLEGAPPARRRARRRRGCGRADRRPRPRAPRRRAPRACSSTRPADRTPAGRAPAPPPPLVAAVARELPVVLAGGLAPATVGDAARSAPVVGVDVASGVERPRDPGRAAHARTRSRSRCSRSGPARPASTGRTSPARPTPVHPGLLEADAAGRWGEDREFGGRYVPETLMAALRQLEDAYARAPPRPALLVGPARAARALRRPPDRRSTAPTGSPTRRSSGRSPPRGRARLPHRLRLHLKREDLAHTGAHKINNALGQALLTRRLGKTRVIAETGAGQHGVATATACALLGLPCVVYMGAEDIERQQPNVLRMRALGAEVRPVTSGSATLKDAINEAMRDWVTNVETTHYVLGSAMGPHPYPTIVRDLQRRIGDEAAAQFVAVEGRLPDLALACVGGGSNAIGLLDRFIGEPSVRIAVDRGGRRRHRDRPARGGARRRHAGDPPRRPLDDAPGSRRPGRRGPLRVGRARLPGRRAADRGARGGRPAGDRRPRPTTRRSRRCAGSRAPRASCRRSRPPMRSRRCRGSSPAPKAADATGPTRRSCCSGFSGRGDKDLAPFGRWHEAHGS